MFPCFSGKNNNVDKSFFADALSNDGRIVIEVEAGRATENNQFLKDIFEASMMFDVEYLVLAVRNVYRTRADLNIVHTFPRRIFACGKSLHAVGGDRAR